jgi:hypothetical protein
MSARFFSLSLSAALLSTSVVSQDWGLSGSWDLVIPSSGTPPTGFAWHHPIAIGGTAIFAANNTATGLPTAFSFDVATSSWSQFPDNTLAGSSIQQGPFMFAVGGIAVLLSESNPNTLYTIDSANPYQNGWQTTQVTVSAPTGRMGMRFFEWGGVVYFFGGFDTAMHNDFWGMDVSGVLTTMAPASWNMIQGDNTPGMPGARIGYTFTAFNVIALMYGGVSPSPTAPIGFNPYTCGEKVNVDAGYCIFHQHVHGVLPGNQPPREQPPSVPVTRWAQLPLVGANGGPVPAGRFEQAAGYLGDQLFVFGGITATGPSSELWAFNLHYQTWAQVQPTNPWPSGFYGTGLYLGYSFYVIGYSGPPGVRPDPTLPVQLWKWSPGGAPPSSNSDSANSAAMAAIATGHTAGIVIGLLLGIASLAFLIVLWRKSGGGLGVSTSAMGDVYSQVAAA